MARDEEIDETESLEAQEEAAPAATEFVPEQTHKPKSDVYTMLLILTFLAFLGGCIVAGREAWENYDVQFWVFNKDKTKGASTETQSTPPSTTNTSTETPKEPMK